jgi:thiamine phosphate synthase YjbQ (UPF0047 family)
VVNNISLRSLTPVGTKNMVRVTWQNIILGEITSECGKTKRSNNPC